MHINNIRIFRGGDNMGPIATLLAIFGVLAAPGAISYITKLFS